MTLEVLIEELKHHTVTYPSDTEACTQVIDWIEKYREFAFVKDNLA